MKKILLLAFMLCIAALTVSADKSLSVILLNQDPDPALAGDITELRLGISNKGDESFNNLMIEIDPAYPFELAPGEDAIQELGYIASNVEGDNIKIIRYKVRVDRDAIAGDYTLYLMDYEEGHRNPDLKRGLSISVNNKESAEVIYIDTVLLVPGKEKTIKFTINNVGSAPLRDLTFSWENEDDIILPVGSDNTKYIKYIDVGDSVVLSYNVIADSEATAGLYKLDLKLTYDDPTADEAQEISTIAGLYVGGGTDFEVAFSEYSMGEYSFSISNIGSNPANSVSIIIPQQDGWKVSGSNSVIIGNLNKGDYTVASFNLQPSTVSRKESSLIVRIAYTNTKGDRKTVQKNVMVNPVSINPEEITAMRGQRTTNTSSFSFIKWAVVIVVLFFVGRYFYKKKAKKKKR